MKKVFYCFTLLMIIIGLAACDSNYNEYTTETPEYEYGETYESEAYNTQESIQYVPEYDEGDEQLTASDPWHYYHLARDKWFLERLQELQSESNYFRRLNSYLMGIYSLESRDNFLVFAHGFFENNPEYTWHDAISKNGLLPDSIINILREEHDNFDDNAIVDYAALSQLLEIRSEMRPMRVFSWSEFVTPAQMTIVNEYLGIPDGKFDDQLLIGYVMDVIVGAIHGGPPHTDILRYYDIMPFDENTDNPRRVLVRMYETLYMIMIEDAVVNPPPGVYLREDVIRYNRIFGREIADWRAQGVTSP